MNWTKDRSIVLSQFCVGAFALLLLAIDILGYWLVGFFIQLRNMNWQLGAVILGAVPVQRLCLDSAVAAVEAAGEYKGGPGLHPGEYKPYAHRQLVLRRRGPGVSSGGPGLSALFHLRHGRGLYGPDSQDSEKRLPAGPADERRTGLYGVRAGPWRYL